ncbi:Uncharacterised protein [uncultured archaeon]|nr:Uncharacterised protein [uncultured archaeon]
MMRLSQELGKNKFSKKIQPILTFQPMGISSSLSPLSPFMLLENAPLAGELAVFGHSNFSGTLTNPSKEAEKNSELQSIKNVEKSGIGSKRAAHSASQPARPLNSSVQINSNTDSRMHSSAHAAANTSASASKTVSTAPISNSQINLPLQTPAFIPASASHNKAVIQSENSIQSENKFAIQNKIQTNSQIQNQSQPAIENKIQFSISDKIAQSANQFSVPISSAAQIPSPASNVSPTSNSASTKLIVTHLQTAQVIVAQAQALSVKVSKHIKHSGANAPIITKAIPLPAKPKNEMKATLVVNKANLLSNKIKAKLVVNKTKLIANKTSVRKKAA